MNDAADRNIASAERGWSRLAEGVAFAIEVHAKQVRKGSNTPYISHLLSVAGLVLEHGGDEEQAVAAMLHDAVEDVGPHLESVIRARFGDRVADIVLGCTDADEFPKPPWQARKEAYIAHLETASPDVWLVSLADKVHNARTIATDLRSQGRAVFGRFRGGLDGTIWYYETLASVFSRLLPGPLAQELVEAVRLIRDKSGVGSD